MEKTLVDTDTVGDLIIHQGAVARALEPDNFVESLETVSSNNFYHEKLNFLLTDKRTLVVIEGSHLHQIKKDLDFEIDFKKLLRLFQYNSNLLRMVYYTNIINNGQYNSTYKLVDYLKYNGYTVNCDYLEDMDTDHILNVKARIITDMFTYTINKAIDHIVLIAGSGQYTYPVEALKLLGCGFTVISTQFKRDPGNDDLVKNNRIASSLRGITDNYFDMTEISEQIVRQFD